MHNTINLPKVHIILQRKPQPRACPIIVLGRGDGLGFAIGWCHGCQIARCPTYVRNNCVIDDVQKKWCGLRGLVAPLNLNRLPHQVTTSILEKAYAKMFGFGLILLFRGLLLV